MAGIQKGYLFFSFYKRVSGWTSGGASCIKLCFFTYKPLGLCIKHWKCSDPNCEICQTIIIAVIKMSVSDEFDLNSTVVLL